MRNFSAQETEWLEELDGIELASFWRRACAFLIDWMIVAIVLTALVTAVAAGFFSYMQRHGKSIEDIAHMFPTAKLVNRPEVAVGGHLNVKTLHIDESRTGEVIKDVTNVLVPILYFGILLWKGKGRTPGKRLTRIRVVSIVHRHLSFWHSVERALGYAAAALEGGFGFIQFFIHPYRRCAQDRLAETMVVTERGYQAMQQKRQHALLLDTSANRDAPE
ncbi:MAG TPA: RDD family protein [Edaphobacter sp.]|jgi:uncharacterized RDD family membrane protein YckC